MEKQKLNYSLVAEIKAEDPPKKSKNESNKVNIEKRSSALLRMVATGIQKKESPSKFPKNIPPTKISTHICTEGLYSKNLELLYMY